jgi:hypothetical protein
MISAFFVNKRVSLWFADQRRVAGAGFESGVFSQGNSMVSDGGDAQSDALAREPHSFDRELQAVVAAWSSLSGDEKLQIFDIVQSSGDE